ncbi:MAG: ribonuclease R [Archangium sp.]|nr:ribonuclease R [Archangium sp.]
MPPPPGPARTSRRERGDPPATAAKQIRGTIHHHPDGFAFVAPVGGAKGEDIFIPPDEARKAVDHDQVVIELARDRTGRSSGRVVAVEARTRQLVVGTYVEQGNEAMVKPREAELGIIRVPKTQLARPGDMVKVRLGVGAKLLRTSAPLTGEVAGSLGAEADHSVEVLSVAFSKGFQDEFAAPVMDEADAFALTVDEAEATAPGRRDLRSTPLVTIDGEDARDFDDAIYVEPHAKGTRLIVAIADVSHYVREGSALDAEALRRGTSVYLPGRVLPMLPERLSNGLCSLKPDEDRLCMVADMVIDASGATIASEVYPAVMRSAARCTYTEVHHVLNGESVPHRNAFKPLFERANELAKRLTAMRRARGAVDFDLPETRVELNEADGLPARMVRRERWESHRLVEECMLAANEAVARFFRERGLPTVNRYHGAPDDEKLALFTTLLGAYGIRVKGALTSLELNAVLQKLQGHAEQRALTQLALRSMMQAVYSSANSGHYGLGAEDYLHFTSPIRRYPDLLVHRLLKTVWAQGKKKGAPKATEALEAMAQQSSERERAAMQVEREVNQLYACLLMRKHVGETFAATVTGLTEHGFFVELTDVYVDVFVKGETVFPRFRFEQATHRITFGDGRVVKVGTPCEVRLLSVNIKRKQMDAQVVAFEKGSVPARPPRAAEAPAASPGVGAVASPPAAPVERERGFDSRAVLDRLWKERGGRPAESRSGARYGSRGDDQHRGGGPSGGGHSGGGGNRSRRK